MYTHTTIILYDCGMMPISDIHLEHVLNTEFNVGAFSCFVPSPQSSSLPIIRRQTSHREHQQAWRRILQPVSFLNLSLHCISFTHCTANFLTGALLLSHSRVPAQGEARTSRCTPLKCPNATAHSSSVKQPRLAVLRDLDRRKNFVANVRHQTSSEDQLYQNISRVSFVPFRI